MADVVTTLVLFALEREAKPFRRCVRRRADIRIEVVGIGQAAVERTLPGLLRQASPTRVIMAGFCGALREGLAVGDVLVPTSVANELGEAWDCQISSPESLRLLTMDRMVGDPREKQTLGERHDAAIVDMESAAAAEICREHGVSFLAVRAVSDEVHTRLSPDLGVLLDGGNISLGNVIRAIVRRPGILREFLRLGRDTKAAAAQLALHLSQVCASTGKFEAGSGTVVPTASVTSSN